MLAVTSQCAFYFGGGGDSVKPIDPFFQLALTQWPPFTGKPIILPNDPFFGNICQIFIFPHIFVKNASKCVLCKENLPKFVLFSLFDIPFFVFSLNKATWSIPKLSALHPPLPNPDFTRYPVAVVDSQNSNTNNPTEDIGPTRYRIYRSMYTSILHSHATVGLLTSETLEPKYLKFIFW